MSQLFTMLALIFATAAHSAVFETPDTSSVEFAHGLVPTVQAQKVTSKKQALLVRAVGSNPHKLGQPQRRSSGSFPALAPQSLCLWPRLWQPPLAKPTILWTTSAMSVELRVILQREHASPA